MSTVRDVVRQAKEDLEWKQALRRVRCWEAEKYRKEGGWVALLLAARALIDELAARHPEDKALTILLTDRIADFDFHYLMWNL